MCDSFAESDATLNQASGFVAVWRKRCTEETLELISKTVRRRSIERMHVVRVAFSARGEDDWSETVRCSVGFSARADRISSRWIEEAKKGRYLSINAKNLFFMLKRRFLMRISTVNFMSGSESDEP